MITPDMADLAAELWADGYSKSGIAGQLKVSIASAWKMIKADPVKFPPRELTRAEKRAQAQQAAKARWAGPRDGTRRHGGSHQMISEALAGRAAELFNGGLSRQAVADRLGVGRTLVGRMMERWPALFATTEKRSLVQGRSTLQPIKGHSWQKIEDRPKPGPVDTRAPAPEGARMVPLTATRDLVVECRWPMWRADEGAESGFPVCGKAVTGKGSYCAHHARFSYQQKGE